MLSGGARSRSADRATAERVLHDTDSARRRYVESNFEQDINDPHTYDLILNTEQTVHKVVRAKNPGALPPELHCVRPREDTVVITYTSKRKMCAVAIGISRGVAKHYAEHIAITEPACMLRGDASCQIVVKRTS